MVFITVQCGTVQSSVVHYNSLWYSTVQSYALHLGVVQYSRGLPIQTSTTPFCVCLVLPIPKKKLFVNVRLRLGVAVKLDPPKSQNCWIVDFHSSKEGPKIPIFGCFS